MHVESSNAVPAPQSASTVHPTHDCASPESVYEFAISHVQSHDDPGSSYTELLGLPGLHAAQPPEPSGFCPLVHVSYAETLCSCLSFGRSKGDFRYLLNFCSGVVPGVAKWIHENNTTATSRYDMETMTVAELNLLVPNQRGICFDREFPPDFSL